MVFLRYTSSFLSYPNGRGLELNRNFLWNADYIGDEFHPDLVLQNWRVIFARMKNRQGAVASWRNAPTWILPKFRTAPGRTLYAWALGRMNRANVWYRSGDYEFSRKLHTWTEQMKDQFARPLSDVAVLLSQSSRDLTDRAGDYHREHGAWLQTLAEENIQYDVILERDLKPAKLDVYRVLVLPDTLVLSDQQAEVIRNFAWKGGRVLATFQTGFYDEHGQLRRVPVLSQVMNVAAGKTEEGAAELRISKSIGAEVVHPPLSVTGRRQIVQLIEPGKSKVLASSTGPAIVETKHGDGSFLFVNGLYLSQNYEPRVVSQRNRTTLKGRFQYPVDFNAGLSALAGNLLRYCIGKRYKTRAVDVPPGVIYAAFLEKTDHGEAIVLHLLNCSGKPHLKKGDTVAQGKDVPQPDITRDMVFQVRPGWPVRYSYVCSPLGKEKTFLSDREVHGSVVTLRVPKSALKNYAMVRLVR